MSWESGADGPWRLTYRGIGDAPTEIVVPRRWAGARARVRVEGAQSRWLGDALLAVEKPDAEIVVVEIERP